MTARWACFALWGPRARDVLAPLTPDPLDFAYMTVRDIAVGDVPVRALRVTFVGELGLGAVLPDRVRRRAVAHAVGGGRAARAGRRRLPRDRHPAPGEGLPASGRADITPDETPLRGGPGLLRPRDKDVPRRATRCATREPRPRALRCLVLEDPRSVALGNEPVRVGGEVVGRVTTGGYGYTVGALDRLRLSPGGARPGTAVEVDIFGRWVGGEVAAEPLYDPEGSRVREVVA